MAEETKPVNQGTTEQDKTRTTKPEDQKMRDLEPQKNPQGGGGGFRGGQGNTQGGGQQRSEQ